MKAGVSRLAGLAVLVLLILSMAACTGAAAPAASDATPLPPVLADTNVVAEGSVVPVQSATLAFAASGVVDEVLVEEGQQVNKDEPIAQLQGRDKLAAAVTGAELELLGANQALKDLNENAEQVKSAAELRLANAQDALDTANDHRTWKNYKNGSQDAIDLARADLVLAQDQVDKFQETFDGVADRGESDITRAQALSALSAAEKARDRAELNLNYLLKMPDTVEVAKADADVSVAQSELDAAQREFDRVKGGPDPDDLALAQARITNAQAQLTAAQSNLDDLELVAPFSGTVVSSGLKAGELVSPQTSTVVLADLSKWKVETTDLTELNVVGIHPGDPVTVKFDALPDVALKGKVARIKALGENRQGDITYTVTVDLLEQNPELRWNMTAIVTFE